MEVDWRMATSSDAGGQLFIRKTMFTIGDHTRTRREKRLTVTGNIPRFVTNSSLPSSIAEDVPSFLAWIEKKFPEPAGGPIGSEQAA